MSQPRRWLDEPRHQRRLVLALYGACALLLAADLVVHRHGHFSFEQGIGFFGLFGFVAYVSIVNAGKLLRRLVKRPEDYYAPGERGDD